ncbi:MAG TPA: TonB-dependent receptor plug domain-containing protein, partial [Candidatus Eisenbacteria bacterium]
MVAPLIALLVAAAVDSTAAPAATAPAPPDTASAPGDTAAASRRIVREFPPITVHAPLHDMRSSESVQIVSTTALRRLPVDRLSELLALKAGVVAQGEELHVRGGRAGETRLYLSGVDLADPVRGQSMELPLLALRSAEVVTGAPDAEFGGALAGVVNAITLDPDVRFGGDLLWESSAGAAPRTDRAAARVGLPLGPTGLGLIASGETLLQDPAYPTLRSNGRTEVLGGSFGWRADNHMIGYLKLAPTQSPHAFALELLVNRRVYEPFDPMWSLDGWTTPEVPLGPGSFGPGFSPDSVPGWGRYRAADHKTMTDDRRAAASLSLQRARAHDRWSASLGWTHARTITSLGGSDDDSYLTKSRGAVFGVPDVSTSDPFHVYYGEEPYFRRAISNVLTARGD